MKNTERHVTYADIYHNRLPYLALLLGMILVVVAVILSLWMIVSVLFLI